MRQPAIAALFLLSACGADDPDLWLKHFDTPTASIHDRSGVDAVLGHLAFEDQTDDLRWTDPWAIIYGNGAFTTVFSTTTLGYSCADAAFEAKREFQRQSEVPDQDMNLSFKEDIEECSARRGRGEISAKVKYDAEQSYLRYKQVMRGFCEPEGACVDGVSVRVWEEQNPRIRARSIWDLQVRTPGGHNTRRLGGYDRVSGINTLRELVFVRLELEPASYVVETESSSFSNRPFVIKGRDGEMECVRFTDTQSGVCRPEGEPAFNWPDG